MICKPNSSFRSLKVPPPFQGQDGRARAAELGRDRVVGPGRPSAGGTHATAGAGNRRCCLRCPRAAAGPTSAMRPPLPPEAKVIASAPGVPEDEGWYVHARRSLRGSLGPSQRSRHSRLRPVRAKAQPEGSNAHPRLSTRPPPLGHAAPRTCPLRSFLSDGGFATSCLTEGFPRAMFARDVLCVALGDRSRRSRLRWRSQRSRLRPVRAQKPNPGGVRSAHPQLSTHPPPPPPLGHAAVVTTFLSIASAAALSLGNSGPWRHIIDIAAPAYVPALVRVLRTHRRRAPADLMRVRAGLPLD